MEFTTVKEWLEANGRAFPEYDAEGCISEEAYRDAGLPMVVACAHCQMTMALTPNRQCDKNGFIFCSECAEG